MNSVREQIKKHLSTILTFEPDESILDYISSIKTEENFEEFTQSILDTNNKNHLDAHEAIKNLLFNQNVPNSSTSKVNKKQEKFEKKPLKSKKNEAEPTQNSGKGKKKFQNIKDFKEKEKIKKGREPCNCWGQKHGFMNNCLNCGRLHCLQEGPGPCLFCGVHLSESGRNEMKTPNIRPRENKIYDDDNDYFKTRAEGEKKKKSMVIALDLATRKVVESTEEDEKLRKKMLEDCKKHLVNVQKLYESLQKSSEFESVTNIYEEMADLMIKMRRIKLDGVEPDLSLEDSRMPDASLGLKRMINEEFDQGLCLSMHQPYASLLIAGVKRHEGRNWPTNHRGTLWIAAAAHKPDPDEVQQVELFYQNYYDDPSLKFPSTYPTSCLLGCVEVVDCLPQETYRKNFPNGESNSPFVLVCANPTILPIFYPIVGKHKIYALDKDLHKCAKMCLRYANLDAGGE